MKYIVPTTNWIDHLAYNSPLNDIRLRTWERLFPGCSEEFGEIFQTMMPAPAEVARWKESWVATTPFHMSLSSLDLLNLTEFRARAFALTKQLGIHPYFWEIHRKSTFVADDQSLIKSIQKVRPHMSFYKEEHLVMFKLAW